MNNNIILTKQERQVYDALCGEPTTIEKIANEVFTSNKQIVRVFVNLRHYGYVIKRKRLGRRDVFLYFIDNHDAIEKPRFKETFKNDVAYGKQLYSDVSKLSGTLINQRLIDIQPIRFSDGAIAIVFGGDEHLGHTYTDYDSLENVFEIVKDTPGVYFVNLGDFIDNSVNATSPQGATNIVDKEGQMFIGRYLLDMISEKILALLEGNHEIRSFISDHFRVTSYLANKCGAEYMQYGANFDVIIGSNNPIKIYCRHKVDNPTQFNPLHGNTRAILFKQSALAGQADVIVSGHTHESAVGEYKVAGKIRHMAVCGCPVIYDEYADRSGFVPGVSSWPVLIIRKNGAMQFVRQFTQGIELFKLVCKEDGIGKKIDGKVEEEI
jgi:predicted transcriptional regulator/predicted phosphodiesterase